MSTQQLWEMKYDPWACKLYGKTKTHDRTLKTQKAYIICQWYYMKQKFLRHMKAQKALSNLLMILHETNVSKEFLRGNPCFLLTWLRRNSQGVFPCVRLTSTVSCPPWRASCLSGTVCTVCPLCRPWACFLIHDLASGLEEKHLFSEISIGRHLGSVLWSFSHYF